MIIVCRKYTKKVTILVTNSIFLACGQPRAKRTITHISTLLLLTNPSEFLLF
jgi:uncharacterized membrane protein